ncbi:MAG TPA: hybrid sensor histidine kinase/response regulator, partial [Phenylobacterium sp.]
MRDSQAASARTPKELRGIAMAQAPISEAPRARFDPLTAIAVLFFLLALGCAAAPAINAGPATVAGLLLLAGLAGVACLALVVVRGSADVSVDNEPGPDRLVEALPEPAAIAAADGRIHAANASWRDVVGQALRLPKNGPSAASLFAALSSARKGEAGRASIRSNGAEHEAVVSPIGARRFLIRLAGAPAEHLALPKGAMDVLAAFSTATPPPPKVLDAFAAASPFGAALLEGEDPFESKIVEANPALKAVAGGGEKGQVFGELIDPASRADASQKLSAGAGAAAPVEVRLAYDPSRIAHLYLSKSDGRWVAYLVDVSEQKQIELQL